MESILPTSLPCTLVIAWAMFFAFLLAQAHHERELKATPSSSAPNLLKATEISSLLGLFFGIGVLGYYFYKVAWYWPLILVVGGSIIGALILGLLIGLIGNASVSKRAFIGWPLCVLWAIQCIHGIG
jgi:hypothetical protein